VEFRGKRLRLRDPRPFQDKGSIKFKREPPHPSPSPLPHGEREGVRGQCQKKILRFKAGMNLHLFKHIFGGAAHGTDPIVREFIEGCIGWDIPIGIPFFWIVNITADNTFPFFHLNLLVGLFSIFQIPPQPPSVSSRTDFAKGGARGDYRFSPRGFIILIFHRRRFFRVLIYAWLLHWPKG